MASSEPKKEPDTKMTTEPPKSPPPKTPTTTYYPLHDLRHLLCATIVTIILLIGIAVLVTYLVYRPNKPRFNVQGVSVFELNTTSPYTIATSMQFTVVMSNPNKRVGIYYDQLTAFVSYRNQVITMPTPLPPLYLGHKSSVVMSPFLGGGIVPVSPVVSQGLVMDQNYGLVGMRFVLLGKMRWKAGAIKTGHYGIYVKCEVLMGLKSGVAGQVPVLGSQDCSVEI